MKSKDWGKVARAPRGLEMVSRWAGVVIPSTIQVVGPFLLPSGIAVIGTAITTLAAIRGQTRTTVLFVVLITVVLFLLSLWYLARRRANQEKKARIAAEQKFHEAINRSDNAQDVLSRYFLMFDFSQPERSREPSREQEERE